MDVDEEHRLPIQRPWLTVVIDVYSRMVLGFAIYLEKPSAFTAGLACSWLVRSISSVYATSSAYFLLSIIARTARRFKAQPTATGPALRVPSTGCLAGFDPSSRLYPSAARQERQ